MMRGLKIIESKRRYRRLRHICWALCLGSAAVLLLGVLALYWFSQGPERGQNFVTRQVPRVFTDLGNTVPVELHLDPTAFASGARIPEEGWRLDIFLGIDNSLTMQYEGEGGSPIGRVMAFARGLIEATDLERHQVALVRMDEEAGVIHPLSRNRTTLMRTLEELPAGRSTRVGAALDAMGPELESLRRQPGALAVLILLTDGRTAPESAQRAAERLTRGHGAYLAPIGLGEFVDDDLLRSLASFPSEYGRGGSADELIALYRGWIDTFERLVAVDVRLTEHFQSAGFQLDAAPGAVVEAEQLEWRLPFLTDKSHTFAYRLETGALGWYAIDESQGEVALTPVGGEATRWPVHRKPKVVVAPPWLWWLLALVPLLLLLPWVLAWWRRWLVARDGAKLPEELPDPDPRPLPELLPALDLERLVRPTPPAVILGLGGTGRWVLTFLKKALLDTNFGRLPDTVKLLLVDTRAAEEDDERKQVEVGGVRLEADECLILEGDPADPGALYERTRRLARGEGSEPHLESWWPAADFSQLPAEQLQLTRGTHQRRPMGRMALFLDLEQGASESRLWRRLQGLLEAASQAGEGDLTVFLAASTLGGSGGGMVLDTAYLTRKIALGAGLTGTAVNLFLALPECFATVSDPLGLAAPNSFALLRELDRFLSQRNRRFPIRYTPGGDDPLDGCLEAPLVDNCYLFDGQRQRHPLTEVRAEKAVLPMMADALHAFLHAAPGGGFDAELKQRKAVAELALEASGHGVVASLGSYVFRLPMRDYLERFKPRFSRELLCDLFSATRGGDGSWQIPPPTADQQAVLDVELDELLRREGGEGTPADFLQAVATGDPELLLAVLEADRALADEERYLDLHLANGRKLLISFWLSRLTAASMSEKGVEGRFSASLYLADELRRRLSVFAETLGEMRHSAIRGRSLRLARRWVRGYEEVVSEIAARLGAYRTGVPVLLETLEAAERACLAGRRREAELPVREVLYDEELEERLYRDHLGEEVRRQCLERFVWRATGANDDELELQVVADSVHPVSPRNPADAAASIKPVAALVEFLLLPMWELEATPYLEESYPEPAVWAERVFERAAPTITFDRAAAPQYGEKLFTTLGEGEYAEAACERLYPEFPRRRHVRCTESRDPHSLSTVILVDSLPLPSLTAYRKAREAYSGFPDSTRATLHLFSTERRTVELERRLPTVQEPHRCFHPCFVADLMEESELLAIFAQAVLYGLVPGFFELRTTTLSLEMDGNGAVLRLATEGGRLEALATFSGGWSQDGNCLSLEEIEAAVGRVRAGLSDESKFLIQRLTELQRLKAEAVLADAECDLLSYLSLAAQDGLDRLRGLPQTRPSGLTVRKE